MSGVNEGDLSFLAHVPSGDSNFKYCLERANEATIRAALAVREGQPHAKTAIAALQRQLAKLVHTKEEPMRKKLPEVPVSAAERKDPALHLEMETLRAERDQRHESEVAQTEREQMIARYHEAVGQIKTANMFAEFARVSELVWIQQMRETKAYKEIGTWESFCTSIGYTRQHVEDQLKNLATFGEKFTQTVCGLGVGYRDLRKLRQLSAAGVVQIDDDTITIEGETIPIDKEHAPEIESAVSALLEKQSFLTTRVEKLEKNLKAAVDEETKSLTAEKKALLDRVKKLEVYVPKEDDREWSVEIMKTLRSDVVSVCTGIGKFILDPRMKDDRQLQAEIGSMINHMEMMLRDLRDQFEAEYDIYGE